MRDFYLNYTILFLLFDTLNQGRGSTAAASSQKMNHLCIAKQHKTRKYGSFLGTKEKTKQHL